MTIGQRVDVSDLLSHEVTATELDTNKLSVRWVHECSPMGFKLTFTVAKTEDFLYMINYYVRILDPSSYRDQNTK